MKQTGLSVVVVAALTSLVGCGLDTSNEGTASEVATSVVSGSINSGSSQVGFNLHKARKSPVERVMDSLNPIGEAWAFNWSCTGGTLTPAFSGPAGNPYAYTPVSCTVTWGNGKSASSEWSGPFTLNFGSGCDATHLLIDSQAQGCTVTRTTGSSPVTRTITGPNGGTYAISHDTNGAGTGWDSTVSPAPSNGGVVMECSSAGCASSKTLTINGSHLTGTVNSTDKIWDHTLSTGSSPLTVTGEGTGRVVTGSLTVQHNLAKYTADVTFNSVTFGDSGCCFPTSGNVSAVYTNGAVQKTENLAFSNTCGQATLTKPNGQTVPLTLQHCL